MRSRRGGLQYVHHAIKCATILRLLQCVARYLGDLSGDGVIRATIDRFLSSGWCDCTRDGRRDGPYGTLGVPTASRHWFRLNRAVLGA